MEFVHGKSSSHWERLRVSSYRGFFLFLPRTIPTSTHRQGGGLLSDHPYGHNHLYSQSTDWGWFLKTYPQVRIFAYSPRTGTRSNCLPNPWGVTLITEPNHRRRLHDAVGFFFLTTTNRCIPKGITSRIRTQSLRTGVHDAVGFPFLPRQKDEYPRVLHHAKSMDLCTWHRWIPTGITSRIWTQSLRNGVHDAVGFPFLPRQTDDYPRILHHAFAPKVYGLVYMT